MFEGLGALVRMYPIMSPGRLALAIDAHGADGRLLGTVDGGEVESPGARFIEIDVSASLADAGLLDGAEAFAVRAWPAAGKAPTRVNHQIVYRAAGGGPLESSVNVSLKNPNIFVPPEKTGLAWGQVPVGGEVDSWLGFVSDGPAREAGELEVTFYGADGELARRRWTLPAGGAVRIGSAELAADLGVAERDGGPDYLWYVARCARPELSAFTVSRHRRTGHCSGEHNF